MSRPRFTLGMVLAMLGYFLVLFQIRSFDVFSGDFSNSGSGLALYNVCRVVFLFYFSWGVAGVGWLVGDLIQKKGVSFQLGFLDRQILSFVTGAAVLTLIVFPLGFLNAYYRWGAIFLISPVLLLTFPRLVGLFEELKSRVARGTRLLKAGDAEAWACSAVLAAGLVIASILLLTRVLYPGECGNDVYEHYLPYQLEVVKNHGLQPNDVWMQFFYGKGASLTFLAMLLSDGLACQSVGYLFLLGGAAALYSIVRHVCGDRVWGGTACVVALGCFPFSNPQWGAFHSHHLGVAFWLLALIWFAVLAPARSKAELNAWFACWMGVSAAQVIFFPLSLVFAGPVLALLAGLYLVRRNVPLASRYAWLVIGTGGVLCLIFLLNFALTGLFLDIPLGLMWKLGSQAKFASWASPYLPLYFLEGSEGGGAGLSYAALFSSQLSQSYWIKLDNQNLAYWINLFRLADMPGVFRGAKTFLCLVAAAVASFFWFRKRVEVRWHLTLPMVFVSGIALAACALPGYAPNIYRNYCFMAFVSAGLVCVLWKITFDAILSGPLRARMQAVGSCLVVVVTVSASVRRVEGQRPPGAPLRWQDFWSFASGGLSVEGALARGDGLWPAAVEARKRVPSGEKIYCFNNGFPGVAAHLFPDGGLLTEPSRSTFGGRWQDMVFTDAVTAEAAFRKQKINYFLIDLGIRFFGCIPYSPLFAPDTLNERFEVVWMDGRTCLLTWKGGGGERGKEVPVTFVWAMRDRVKHWSLLPESHPDFIFGGLYKNMKIIYDYNQGQPGPVRRPPDLPRVKGFQ